MSTKNKKGETLTSLVNQGAFEAARRYIDFLEQAEPGKPSPEVEEEPETLE